MVLCLRSLITDDALYVAGAFSNIGGTTRPRLAAITLRDGQVQTNLQFGENASEPALIAMAVSGDLLYLGGGFTTITIGSKVEPRMRLAAVSCTTGALADWKPEANARVQALAVSGDTIYAAGDFTTIGTTVRRYLAGIGTDGSLREDWSPQPGAAIDGIAVDRDSVFAFGADVRSFDVERREHLAAFQNGALMEWAPAVSGGTVHALAAAGTTIFVAGDFDMVGGSARWRSGNLQRECSERLERTVDMPDVDESDDVIFRDGLVSELNCEARHRRRLGCGHLSCNCMGAAVSGGGDAPVDLLWRARFRRRSGSLLLLKTIDRTTGVGSIAKH